MPIETNWDIAAPDQAADTIILTYTGRWTWMDMHTHNQEMMLPLMRSVSHTVHIIADFRTSATLPGGDGFRFARSILRSYPPNWGILVGVTSNLLIRSMISAFRTVQMNDFAPRFYSAETLEQARDIIRKHRSVG